MNERDNERAKLDFGEEESAVPEKPIMNPEAIREVAAQSGFRKTDAHTTRKSSEGKIATPRAAANLPKRTRRKTGRVHQFSTRITRATYVAIYEYANREEITLGETIERAMVLLNGGPFKESSDLSVDSTFSDEDP